jgi:hypothetical protein
MSMPNEKEHLDILKYFNGPDTDKIRAVASEVVSKAEERITKNYLPFAQKVDEHDGFISKIKRNFLGIVKG